MTETIKTSLLRIPATNEPSGAPRTFRHKNAVAVGEFVFGLARRPPRLEYYQALSDWNWAPTFSVHFQVVYATQCLDVVIITTFCGWSLETLWARQPGISVEMTDILLSRHKNSGDGPTQKLALQALRESLSRVIQR